VSPEFIPSEASAEEKGNKHRVAVAAILLIFKLSPPFFIRLSPFVIYHLSLDIHHSSRSSFHAKDGQLTFPLSFAADWKYFRGPFLICAWDYSSH